ncbi:MAG: cytochrome c, partial [Candidatus Acidiferrales bacterium]
MSCRLIRVVPIVFLIATVLVFSSPAVRADDAASLYKSKCAACHAPDGSGSTPTGKAMGSPDLRSAE